MARVKGIAGALGFGGHARFPPPAARTTRCTGGGFFAPAPRRLGDSPGRPSKTLAERNQVAAGAVSGGVLLQGTRAVPFLPVSGKQGYLPTHVEK